MTTLVLFAGGIAMLYIGGEGLVRGAAALGARIGMTPLVVGLTIVAFSTSAPELAISIDAALRGVPGLAIGNVIGSNICNLALILGVTALIRPAYVRAHLVRRDVAALAVSTLLVPIALIDGRLGRLEGSLLVAGVLLYTLVTVRSDAASGSAPRLNVPMLSPSIGINAVIVVASLGTLVVGSDLFVGASIGIATALGVSPTIIGLSATALGTSLPELTTCVVAARHGHPEMAAGNLIGSNLFNLLLILGATALVRPLADMDIDWIDHGMMIAVTALALAFMLLGNRVGRGQGTLLVIVYVGYIGWLFGGG
jgi:cation:H+ antiporter